MAKVEYEGEEIIIDNTELLGGRADISFKPGNEELVKTYPDEEHRPEGGREERELRQDKKRVGWYEASHTTEVVHICPVCGVKFKGRTNKVYCSKKCKETGKKREQRAKTRAVRDFKPHIGTAGEVYFMATSDGKDIISFVPALYAQNRKQASEYIYKHYGNEKNYEDYIEQINEVIPK